MRASASREIRVHDAELVRRFQAGDAGAFTEIVARHRGRMLQVALNLLHNRADAEEVAQDTFIRAHRSLAAFRGESSLATWLHLITLNLSRNRYWYFFRRQRHRTHSLEAAVGPEGTGTFADLIASNAPGPVRETISREFTHQVKACMAQLKPQQLEILNLRIVRQLSYAVIARDLEISPGTVKSRLARAREQLRDLMVRDHAPEADQAEAAVRPWFETLRRSPQLSPL